MTYNQHAPQSPRETAYLMIQHRVVDGVPTTANVRILSTDKPATIGDVFWTCVTTADGATFQQAHEAMIQHVRTARWLAWAVPYIEREYAHVR